MTIVDQLVDVDAKFLLVRALTLLHEWGECVYFSKQEGLRDVVCFSVEFLTQFTVGRLINPTSAHHGLIKNGVISHRHLKDIWSASVVPPESIPRVLRVLEMLQLSFCTSWRKTAAFDDHSSVIPSLLPAHVPKIFESIWPAAGSLMYPVRKGVCLAFDLLPTELMSKLIVAFNESGSCDLLSAWQRGVLLSFVDTIVLVQLELVPEDVELQFQDENVFMNISTGLLQDNQQVIAVRARSTTHDHGHAAIQHALSIFTKTMEPYIGW
jgi:hypothetical protein